MNYNIVTGVCLDMRAKLFRSFGIIFVVLRKTLTMTKVYPIIAEHWKIDGGTCFGLVPKSVWSRYVKTDENNMIPVSSRCLLIFSGKQIILFDTGMGNKQSDKYYSFSQPWNRENFLPQLAKYGVKPEDVTDIIFSHLHWDHTGGASYYDENGVLKERFPNAQYHCSKANWESSQNPNFREAKAFFEEDLSILFNSGKLHLIEKDSYFNSDIFIKLSDGHSLGHIMLIMDTNKGKLAFTADFIPIKEHVPLAWICSQDIHPMETLKDKTAFLNEACDGNYIIMYGHDYYNECSRLERTEKGVVATESFYWNDI